MTGTVNLKGKTYHTVAKRVNDFRAKHPISEGWGVTTEIVRLDDAMIVIRATITDPTGRTVATGYAEEQRSNRGVNATSALENCETSAIGRALAAAGYGGDGEYASADEVAAAIAGQSDSPPRKWTKEESARFLRAIGELGLDFRALSAATEARGWGRPSAWTEKLRGEFLADLRDGGLPEIYLPGAGDVQVDR